MVAGLFAPSVLLPVRALRCPAGCTAAQRQICHELVHLRRGDLWLRLRAGAGRAPLFSSTRWRTSPRASDSLAREAAPRRGRAAARWTPRRRTTAACSSRSASRHCSARLRGIQHIAPRSQSLKRRIGMRESHDAQRPRTVCGWLLAAAAAVAIVPMQVVARTAPATDACDGQTFQCLRSRVPLRQSPAQQSPAPESGVIAESRAERARVDRRFSPGPRRELRAAHPEFVLVPGENHTVMNGSADDRQDREDSSGRATTRCGSATKARNT